MKEKDKGYHRSFEGTDLFGYYFMDLLIAKLTKRKSQVYWRLYINQAYKEEVVTGDRENQSV